ncbi:MAG: MFS transporter [Anaerolineales bacterium]
MMQSNLIATRLRKVMPTGVNELGRDNRLIFLAILLWGMGDGLWLFIQPLYVQQLGASPGQIGLVLGSGMLLTALAFIPAGLWMSRRRRKPIILGAHLLSVVAVFSLALAPSWPWLIPGFVVYQLMALSRPAVSSYVASAGHSSKTNVTFARVFSGYPLGAILTPVLGGWLGQLVGLRIVFLLATGFYLLSILTFSRLTDRPAPAMTETTRPTPLFRQRNFLGTIAFFLLVFLALNVGQPLAPNYLAETAGLQLSRIGLLGSATAIGTAVIAIVLSQLRQESLWPLLLSLGAVLIGLLIVRHTPALPLLLAGCFLLGGAGAVVSLSSGSLSRVLRPASMSLGFGFRDSALFGAMGLAPLLAGWLYNYQPVYPLYAGMAAIGLTMVLTLIVACSRRLTGMCQILCSVPMAQRWQEKWQMLDQS